MYKFILFSLFSLTVYTQNINSVETNNLVNQNYKIESSNKSDSCDTFTHVIGKFYKDESNVYFYEGTTCDSFNFRKIDNVSPNSFSAVGSSIVPSADSEINTLYYAKDNNIIYLYISYFPDIFFTIKNVNTHNFKILNNFYSKDDKKVFRLFDEILGADPNTFIILVNLSYETSYFKDNKKVFFKDKEITGADPNTFTIIDELHSKDDKKMFYKNEELPNS